MRTVEAVWEERNLGVRCFEIEIGKNDSVRDALNIIQNRTEKYYIAKILSGRTDALLAFQEVGFKFIETNFQIEIDLSRKPVPPSICVNLLGKTGYHIGTPEEVEKTIQEIRKGTIFSTDKVALDPFFSQELAGRRYAYWAEDVMASGKAVMVITEYDGQNIGFSIVIDKGTYYDGFLGGLYTQYLNSGLGFANVNATINAVYDLGGMKMISGVSSNNFPMFKLHMLFGLKVRRITYNLIKHI